ncbi:hypothetical protein BJX64DRAFT_294765 [Aspergillus heterothallicus]
MIIIFAFIISILLLVFVVPKLYSEATSTRRSTSTIRLVVRGQEITGTPQQLAAFFGHNTFEAFRREYAATMRAHLLAEMRRLELSMAHVREDAGGMTTTDE